MTNILTFIMIMFYYICFYFKYTKSILVFPTPLKVSTVLRPLLHRSLTWKYFGPLHHAYHLLSGQAVETGQQVVGGVRLRVVITRVHLFGLDQLQNAADGGRQKRRHHPGPMWHQGASRASVQLLFGGQVRAADAACGCVGILRSRQVVADRLQLPELLGLPRWLGRQTAIVSDAAKLIKVRSEPIRQETGRHTTLLSTACARVPRRNLTSSQRTRQLKDGVRLAVAARPLKNCRRPANALEMLLKGSPSHACVPSHGPKTCARQVDPKCKSAPECGRATRYFAILQ